MKQHSEMRGGFPVAAFDTLPEAEGLEVEKRPHGELAITYQSGQTSAEQVLEAVRSAGIRISDVRTEQADLEDVFLDLTRST